MKITFKSEQENYRKEYLNIKNNTMRQFKEADQPDIREEALNQFIKGEINELFIEIQHTNTEEYFSRPVRDVTKWCGWYIITWADAI